MDRVLISLVQEFVAIGKAQDETLAANDHPDAFDSPDWVRLEQRGAAVLARIVSNPGSHRRGDAGQGVASRPLPDQELC